MGKERADLNNHCHSEERSDVGIRSSLKQQCFLHGVKETRIATASLRTGLAMTVVFYTLLFSFTHWHSLPPGDPSVACAAAPIAGAPKGAERCPVAPVLNSCREALPLLGEVARSAEGVARVTTQAEWKRKSRPKQPLSFRGAKRRGNPFSLKQQCFLHGVKETRIATASLRTGLAMTVVF